MVVMCHFVGNSLSFIPSMFKKKWQMEDKGFAWNKVKRREADVASWERRDRGVEGCVGIGGQTALGQWSVCEYVFQVRGEVCVHCRVGFHTSHLMQIPTCQQV